MNSSLYTILLHIHSAGRWVLMLLLIIAIFNSMVAAGRPFIKSDNKTGLLLTITADIMLLIGIALWYFGPNGYHLIDNYGSFGEVMKNATARFYVVEHLTGMLIAIIFIHIGKSQARKKIADSLKHKRTVIFYLLALVVILLTVPWPFREIGAGRGWF